MDPYQQHQQQLMAAFMNGYPPPNGVMPAGTNGGNGMMNPNNMSLTTPFGHHHHHHHHHQHPPPHPHGVTPAHQAPMPLPLPPVRRGGPNSFPVRAPKGMHRSQPKPGHTAKKNDGKCTGPWSHQEHQQFEKAVIIYGWGNWVQVRRLFIINYLPCVCGIT